MFCLPAKNAALHLYNMATEPGKVFQVEITMPPGLLGVVVINGSAEEFVRQELTVSILYGDATLMPECLGMIERVRGEIGQE